MWFEPSGVHSFDGVGSAAVQPHPFGGGQAGLDRLPDEVMREAGVTRWRGGDQPGSDGFLHERQAREFRRLQHVGDHREREIATDDGRGL